MRDDSETGLKTSLILSSTVSNLTFSTASQLFAGEQGVTAEIHMRRKTRLTVDTCQLNIATAGDLVLKAVFTLNYFTMQQTRINISQEAGKSTLIGVLCTGKLDNGKGLARTQVFRHNHEIETGRTSCISHHLLHFDDKGQVRLIFLCNAVCMNIIYNNKFK